MLDCSLYPSPLAAVRGRHCRFNPQPPCPTLRAPNAQCLERTPPLLRPTTLSLSLYTIDHPKIMATTNAYPPGGTFLDSLKKSFTDVPVDKEKDNAVSTTEFLEAAESLTTLFGIKLFPLY
jgi:hypothetical protein